MTLLLPLGLLGLLGIVALIIIYIIKPNYQQKPVSSTYIWKLSLKYKKKKLPINKVRNIILFICQILILALIAWILARPVTIIEAEPLENDVIAIIDSSASMYAETDNETRFYRAVNQVTELSEQTIDAGGYVSVIIADSTPSFLAKRVEMTGKEQLIQNLNDLLDDETACSYGTSDIEAALTLCLEVFEDNSSAKVYLYTDTTYDIVPDDISVVKLTEDGEWNAGILDVTAVKNNDAAYDITVELGAYGAGCTVNVDVTITNVNALDGASSGREIKFPTQHVFCTDGESKKIIYTSSSEKSDADADYYAISATETIYSYQEIYVEISVADATFQDSFSADDSFVLYGGQKEVLKVQYASSLPNDWFLNALDAVKKYYNKAGLWDIQITDVEEGTDGATEGFDFYIFEHTMPEEMPTDGVVVLVNPEQGALPDIGLRVNSVEYLKNSVALVEETSHPITRYINADDIMISKYISMTADSDYTVLMSCNSSPVVMVKNVVTESSASQIVVIGFSVHYSNLSYNNGILATMMANMFEYFMPSTVSGSAFDVDETITLNARSTKLNVTGPNVDQSYTSFPAQLTLSLPGTYTIKQTTYFGDDETLRIFVKIPSEESDVCKKEIALEWPIERPSNPLPEQVDWLVYLAAALTALVFIEWILKSYDNV